MVRWYDMGLCLKNCHSSAPPNCKDLVQPVDAGIGALIKKKMIKMFNDDLESSEARGDAWFDGKVTTSERRVLMAIWLSKAHEALFRNDSRTGCQCT